MAEYEVTAPDGTPLTVTAPDGATDAEVLEYAKRQYNSQAPKDAAPESPQLSAREQEIQRHGLEKVGDYGDGTVYRAPDGSLQFASPTYSTGNPETIQNIMETGKPQGNVPIGEGALRSGFHGISAGTGDEIVAGIASTFGDGTYDDYLARERRLIDQFRDESPVTAYGSEIAGALPMALALPWAAAGSKGPLAAQILKSGGIAAGEGAVYGAASTPGGDGPLMEQAANRAVGGATAGLVASPFGIAAPMASRALSPLAQRLMTKVAAKQSGVTPAAYPELANTARGGVDIGVLDDPTAMMVDTSPAFAGLMDTAIQSSGTAGTQARRVVDDRVADATRRVGQALDDRLGIPGQSTSRALVPFGDPNPLKGLYARAYDTPIDYTSQLGRQIEDMVNQRVPKAAIDRANELMRVQGLKSKQIVARIQDDGTVIFDRMPDVMQLDYITRGLQQVAREADGKGAMGGTTPVGRAYAELAGTIRQNMRELVPEYGQAVDAARNIILSGKAREAGMTLLRPSTTRADVQKLVATMTPEQRLKVREGVRMQIDDTLANVKRTMSDPNVDAREAYSALTNLSSRASQEKVAMVIGEKEAASLFRELESAGRAFNLRANVAANSRTFGRGAVDERIGAQFTEGIVNQARQGKPIASAQGVAQGMFGRSAGDIANLKDEAYGDIVAALLQRGAQARKTIEGLQREPQLVTGPTEKYSELARRLLRGSGLAISAPTASVVQERRR